MQVLCEIYYYEFPAFAGRQGNGKYIGRFQTTLESESSPTFNSLMFTVNLFKLPLPFQ